MAKGGQELVFCSLGGAGEIGMNLNLFGYGKPGEYKWIIVDIGVTFSDDNIPGIEVILPNPEFIANQKERSEEHTSELQSPMYPRMPSSA